MALYLGNDKTISIAGSVSVIKPEQEKTINITKNGETVVTPDNNKTLSKVTVKVSVPSSGGDSDIVSQIESLIDESEVLEGAY